MKSLSVSVVGLVSVSVSWVFFLCFFFSERESSTSDMVVVNGSSEGLSVCRVLTDASEGEEGFRNGNANFIGLGFCKLRWARNCDG